MAVVIDDRRVAAVSPRTTGAHDRMFYGGVAIAAALLTLAGFAPTYYLRFLDGGPSATISGGPISTLLHVHGGLFTAWVLLFITQTALISTRRVVVHRQLGVLGAILAAAMIPAGVIAGIALARRGGAPPGIDPLAFLAIPLGDMVLFASFVTTALLWRRDKESHKRLMLLAYASILAAPAARLPGMMPLGPLAFYGVAFLVVIAGAIYDRVSRGRIHNVYWWGGGLFLVSVPVRLAISGTSPWHAFARFLVGL